MCQQWKNTHIKYLLEPLISGPFKRVKMRHGPGYHSPTHTQRVLRPQMPKAKEARGLPCVSKDKTKTDDNLAYTVFFLID